MTPPISGRTRLAGVIGHPIEHSLSPALFNAAFAAAGLDAVYLAFDVPAGGAAGALAAARALSVVGLSVTMPHKADVASLCDELSTEAAALRSVNCVTRLADGRLRGDSTDGEGFRRALLERGYDPAGRRVLVLGAGGAARAVVHALGRAGCRVRVAARRTDAAVEAAALAPGGEQVPWDRRDDAVDDADLVVQATPVGMGGGGLPLDPGRLGPRHAVADLVYHPLETPLLAAARARGAVAVDGLGMLVHQATLAFEHWTGRAAPLAAMRAAAEAALAGGAA